MNPNYISGYFEPAVSEYHILYFVYSFKSRTFISCNNVKLFHIIFFHRLDIMEIKYRIMLNDTTIDHTKLRRPSLHQFDAAFQSRYHSRLYHGNATGLVPLEYSFSFMLEGSCRTPEDIEIMQKALCDVWATNSSKLTEYFVPSFTH